VSAKVLVAPRSGVTDVVLVATESTVLVAISSFGGVDVLTSSTGVVEVVTGIEGGVSGGVEVVTV
jgi:hypothetical protein